MAGPNTGNMRRIPVYTADTHSLQVTKDLSPESPICWPHSQYLNGNTVGAATGSSEHITGHSRPAQSGQYEPNYRSRYQNKNKRNRIRGRRDDKWGKRNRTKDRWTKQKQARESRRVKDGGRNIGFFGDSIVDDRTENKRWKDDFLKQTSLNSHRTWKHARLETAVENIKSRRFKSWLTDNRIEIIVISIGANYKGKQHDWYVKGITQELQKTDGLDRIIWIETPHCDPVMKGFEEQNTSCQKISSEIDKEVNKTSRGAKVCKVGLYALTYKNKTYQRDGIHLNVKGGEILARELSEVLEGESGRVETELQNLGSKGSKAKSREGVYGVEDETETNKEKQEDNVPMPSNATIDDRDKWSGRKSGSDEESGSDTNKTTFAPYTSGTSEIPNNINGNNSESLIGNDSEIKCQQIKTDPHYNLGTIYGLASRGSISGVTHKSKGGTYPTHNATDSVRKLKSGIHQNESGETTLKHARPILEPDAYALSGATLKRLGFEEGEITLEVSAAMQSGAWNIDKHTEMLPAKVADCGDSFYFGLWAFMFTLDRAKWGERLSFHIPDIHCDHCCDGVETLREEIHQNIPPHDQGEDTKYSYMSHRMWLRERDKGRCTELSGPILARACHYKSAAVKYNFRLQVYECKKAKLVCTEDVNKDSRRICAFWVHKTRMAPLLPICILTTWLAQTVDSFTEQHTEPLMQAKVNRQSRIEELPTSRQEHKTTKRESTRKRERDQERTWYPDPRVHNTSESLSLGNSKKENKTDDNDSCDSGEEIDVNDGGDSSDGSEDKDGSSIGDSSDDSDSNDGSNRSHGSGSNDNSVSDVDSTGSEYINDGGVNAVGEGSDDKEGRDSSASETEGEENKSEQETGVGIQESKLRAPTGGRVCSPVRDDGEVSWSGEEVVYEEDSEHEIIPDGNNRDKGERSQINTDTKEALNTDMHIRDQEEDMNLEGVQDKEDNAEQQQKESKHPNMTSIQRNTAGSKKPQRKPGAEDIQALLKRGEQKSNKEAKAKGAARTTTKRARERDKDIKIMNETIWVKGTETKPRIIRCRQQNWIVDRTDTSIKWASSATKLERTGDGEKELISIIHLTLDPATKTELTTIGPGRRLEPTEGVNLPMREAAYAADIGGKRYTMLDPDGLPNLIGCANHSPHGTLVWNPKGNFEPSVTHVSIKGDRITYDYGCAKVHDICLPLEDIWDSTPQTIEAIEEKKARQTYYKKHIHGQTDIWKQYKMARDKDGVLMHWEWEKHPDRTPREDQNTKGNLKKLLTRQYRNNSYISAGEVKSPNTLWPFYELRYEDTETLFKTVFGDVGLKEMHKQRKIGETNRARKRPSKIGDMKLSSEQLMQWEEFIRTKGAAPREWASHLQTLAEIAPTAVMDSDVHETPGNTTDCIQRCYPGSYGGDSLMTIWVHKLNYTQRTKPTHNKWIVVSPLLVTKMISLSSMRPLVHAREEWKNMRKSLNKYVLKQTGEGNWKKCRGLLLPRCQGRHWVCHYVDNGKLTYETSNPLGNKTDKTKEATDILQVLGLNITAERYKGTSNPNPTQTNGKDCMFVVAEVMECRTNNRDPIAELGENIPEGRSECIRCRMFLTIIQDPIERKLPNKWKVHKAVASIKVDKYFVAVWPETLEYGTKFWVAQIYKSLTTPSIGVIGKWWEPTAANEAGILEDTKDIKKLMKWREAKRKYTEDQQSQQRKKGINAIYSNDDTHPLLDDMIITRLSVEKISHEVMKIRANEINRIYKEMKAINKTKTTAKVEEDDESSQEQGKKTIAGNKQNSEQSKIDIKGLPRTPRTGKNSCYMNALLTSIVGTPAPTQLMRWLAEGTNIENATEGEVRLIRLWYEQVYGSDRTVEEQKINFLRWATDKSGKKYNGKEQEDMADFFFWLCENCPTLKDCFRVLEKTVFPECKHCKKRSKPKEDEHLTFVLNFERSSEQVDINKELNKTEDMREDYACQGEWRNKVCKKAEYACIQNERVVQGDILIATTTSRQKSDGREYTPRDLQGVGKHFSLAAITARAMGDPGEGTGHYQTFLYDAQGETEYNDSYKRVRSTETLNESAKMWEDGGVTPVDAQEHLNNVMYVYNRAGTAPNYESTREEWKKANDKALEKEKDWETRSNENRVCTLIAAVKELLSEKGTKESRNSFAQGAIHKELLIDLETSRKTSRIAEVDWPTYSEETIKNENGQPIKLGDIPSPQGRRIQVYVMPAIKGLNNDGDGTARRLTESKHTLMNLIDTMLKGKDTGIRQNSKILQTDLDREPNKKKEKEKIHMDWTRPVLKPNSKYCKYMRTARTGKTPLIYHTRQDKGSTILALIRRSDGDICVIWTVHIEELEPKRVRKRLNAMYTEMTRCNNTTVSHTTAMGEIQQIKRKGRRARGKNKGTSLERRALGHLGLLHIDTIMKAVKRAREDEWNEEVVKEALTAAQVIIQARAVARTENSMGGGQDASPMYILEKTGMNGERLTQNKFRRTSEKPSDNWLKSRIGVLNKQGETWRRKINISLCEIEDYTMERPRRDKEGTDGEWNISIVKERRCLSLVANNRRTLLMWDPIRRNEKWEGLSDIRRNAQTAGYEVTVLEGTYADTRQTENEQHWALAITQTLVWTIQHNKFDIDGALKREIQTRMMPRPGTDTVTVLKNQLYIRQRRATWEKIDDKCENRILDAIMMTSDIETE